MQRTILKDVATWSTLFWKMMQRRVKIVWKDDAKHRSNYSGRCCNAEYFILEDVAMLSILFWKMLQCKVNYSE
jgi:hypothetical protein